MAETKVLDAVLAVREQRLANDAERTRGVKERNAERLEDAKIDLAARKERLKHFEKEGNEKKIARYQESVKAAEENLKDAQERAKESD